MTDIRHIDRCDLQQLLAAIRIEAKTDSDGLLFVVFPADEEFDHDVVFHFVNDDNGWFGIEAIADEYTLAPSQIGTAMAMCNEYSRRARLPKAFVSNMRIKLEQWIMLPIATDDDYIKQYIELVLAMCWRFYVEFNHELISNSNTTIE